jgi:hypothetical protein
MIDVIPAPLPRGRPTPSLVLAAADRAILEQMAASRSTPRPIVTRARIILACADGLRNAAVALQLGTTAQRVGRCRAAYLARGLDAVQGRSARGRQARKSDAIALLQTALAAPPPQGAPRWTTRALAARCGVSQPTITRLLRVVALRESGDLVLAGVFIFARDCVAVLREAPEVNGVEDAAVPGHEVADPLELRALREHAAACARLSVKRGGGLKLQRFLKSIVRRHPAAPLALAFAHTDPPSRAVRRFIDKHPVIRCHHFGAAHHWWSLIARRLGDPLREAIRARCAEAPLAKPFVWTDA